MITDVIRVDNSMMNLFRFPLLIQKWNARIVKKRILNGCCQRQAFPPREVPFQPKDPAVHLRDSHEQAKPVVTG
jgi:hypothetical protein